MGKKEKSRAEKNRERELEREEWLIFITRVKWTFPNVLWKKDKIGIKGKEEGGKRKRSAKKLVFYIALDWLLGMRRNKIKIKFWGKVGTPNILKG